MHPLDESEYLGWFRRRSTNMLLKFVHEHVSFTHPTDQIELCVFHHVLRKIDDLTRFSSVLFLQVFFWQGLQVCSIPTYLLTGYGEVVLLQQMF